MDWLAQNWLWVLVFAAFIGMHLFGHGGQGGHGGGCGGHGSHTRGEKQRGSVDEGEQDKDRPQGHRH